MIALNPGIRVIAYALRDEVPWFLVLRPRDVSADAWEPLCGEAAPGESAAAAAMRIAREAGLEEPERVQALEASAFEHRFAVRVADIGAVAADRERHDDARWVPFHAAAPLLAEADKRALRRLNMILDVLLRRVEVVFEEIHDEGGCSSDGCSSGGCSSGSCGTDGRGCGQSPFLDGRPLSGEKVPAWLVDGVPSGCAGCASAGKCGVARPQSAN